MAIIIAVVAVAVVLDLGFILRRFMAYRGQRVVVCPETRRPAGVELDAWQAVRRGIEGHADLHLKSCSRWPERHDCGQDCLSQIEASPEGTLVRNMVTAWYRDKRCLYCRRTIGEIAWHDAMPGLRAPDGKLREWSDVATADVPAVLQTHDAVCRNCDLAESFRREHPDLVTDRADTPLRNRAIH
jgi:hypothetical protein